MPPPLKPPQLHTIDLQHTLLQNCAAHSASQKGTSAEQVNRRRGSSETEMRYSHATVGFHSPPHLQMARA